MDSDHRTTLLNQLQSEFLNELFRRTSESEPDFEGVMRRYLERHRYWVEYTGVELTDRPHPGGQRYGVSHKADTFEFELYPIPGFLFYVRVVMKAP